MPVSPAELARIDAELDALAAGTDLERAWSMVRSAPRVDLGEVDSALAALAADVPTSVEPPKRASRADAPARRSEPQSKLESKPAESKPAEAAAAAAASQPAAESAPDVAAVEPDLVFSGAAPESRTSDVPIAIAADVPDALEDAAVSAEALLNPFEEPRGEEFEDEQTMVIDAGDLGGLDMDALFDGMVEEALSAPLEEGGIVGGRSLPPITEYPPEGEHVEGATDIEQLRPDGDDELDLFVEDGSIGFDEADALQALEVLEPSDAAIANAEDGPDDDSPKKKGFLKKLFG